MPFYSLAHRAGFCKTKAQRYIDWVLGIAQSLCQFQRMKWRESINPENNIMIRPEKYAF